jgi:methyl-accepting chemotaxis protein
MNSERASNNISEISRAAKEMASGVTDISKNVQLINEEAGAAQQIADMTKQSSGELLKTAGDIEDFISKYKIN